MNEENMNENKVSRLAICSFVLGLLCFAGLFVSCYEFSFCLSVVNVVLGLFVLLKKGLKSRFNVKLALSGILCSIIVFSFLFGYSIGDSKGFSSARDYFKDHIDELQMYDLPNTSDY